MATEINFKPTPKQAEIFKLFDNPHTTEVVYGGSLSSGKSYVLAALLVMKCIQHKAIRIGLARNELTTLKKTTVVSLMEVLGDWGLKAGEHYNYNSQSGIIRFFNDSEIVLTELRYLPSDPQYTRLGGLLFTFGVIDEAGEIDERGKEIFQSRLGRWKNNEFDIKPFLLMTCNPSKNFLYREYYVPNIEDNLKDYQAFIQALPSDNPHISKEYLSNLERTMSLNEKRRLLRGEWDVADDETSLFKFGDIQLAYDTSIYLDDDDTMRMSCDIAFTSDKCIFVVWSGLTVKKIVEYDKANDQTIVDRIKELAKTHNIRTDNISYDADGVGKYIKQYLPSAREIHNNGKTIQNDGYKNLKAELFFKLSELMKEGKVKIEDPIFRKDIEEELSIIKHKPRESMDKLELITKTEMKRLLGRSPDFADALAYGMFFQLRNTTMTASDFVFISI